MSTTWPICTQSGTQRRYIPWKMLARPAAMMVAPIRRWSERKPVAIAIGWMTSAAEMMPVEEEASPNNCAELRR